MPFEDLDLEFEDEEEARKKKSDAVQVNVDLEFSSPAHEKSKFTAKPAVVESPAISQGSKPNIQRPAAVVKKIDEARVQAMAKKVSDPSSLSSSLDMGPRAVGSSALKEDFQEGFEAQEIIRLREQMRQVEFDAAVRVAVAEYKTELLGELFADMKLMEHQIGQMLIRINAKHPDMKQEALMIKKILADFTSKKRK